MTSPARSSRTQTVLAGTAGRGVGTAQAVIDETNLDTDIDGIATDLAAHAATVSAVGVHGRLVQVLVDGQDETGTPAITVTGIAVGDALVSFLVLATKASIATAAYRALSDFTITADTLTVGANAANNTNNQYLITYLDAA